MSKRMTVVLLLLVCFSFVISAGIVAAKNDVLEKYLTKGETEIVSDLEALDTAMLISEIDSLAIVSEETNDQNILMPAVAELLERKDKISDSELMKVIKDKSKSDIARSTMVEVYFVKNEGKEIDKELKDLLKSSDVNVSKEVKTKIVAGAKFTKEDIHLLKELISENDDLLAFHSLKQLSKTNPEEAYELSSEILTNIHSASNDKISAALKSTSVFLQNQKANESEYMELEEEFINQSLEIIEQQEDIYIQDSAFFAMSDLQSKEAIQQILESESIDRELKIFSIDQNFMALKEMLLNEPTEKDIELVVMAMELFPITDLIEGLEEAVKTVEDPTLKQKTEDVILIMKEQGISGNTKWMDKN